LEWPIYSWALLQKRQSGTGPLPLPVRSAIASAILNLATHPFIYLVIPILMAHFQSTYLTYLTVSEVFAPAIEALLLWHLWSIPAGKSIFFSLVANLFSWGAGLKILAWLN
jgi:hypothetical protein